MLHHSVLYNTTLWHFDLNGKVNDKGIYRHFVTVKNMSTLHCYQVRKKVETTNNHKVKTGYFWSKHFYNTFTNKLGPEAHFEGSDNKIDSKYDSTTNTNIKECGNDVNGQVDEPDVDFFNLPGTMNCKALCTRVTRRTLHLNSLMYKHFRRYEYILYYS